MSHERDTLPPDFGAMDEKALLVYLADAIFEFRQEQIKQGDVLELMRAELTLVGNQLVTGDQDPRTIAQRLQSLESGIAYLAEEKERLRARVLNHESRPADSAHGRSFVELQREEIATGRRGGGE